MRLIHLCFQLHWSQGLHEADVKERFAKANEQVYQPFFALMERNAQRYDGWHFSLMISGTWLTAAEKYDRNLIERLKKLLKTGRIELVNEPFYHSLAFFYNKDELAKQVELYQQKTQDLFGIEGRIFAMPDFMYNDAIAKWAEGFGFAGMLVGGGEKLLDFRSANHVYEAAGCEYLRLLFQNRHLTRKVEQADEEILTETERNGEKKKVLSAKKFQKKLDLECLRGNLINLYFDTEILAKQREKGIIGFFDLLIENWLAVSGNKFVNAKEACFVETPTVSLSIRETIDWRSTGEKARTEDDSALVLAKEIEYKLPERLSGKAQEEFGRKLYALGREVAASEDDDLLEEFRGWTVKDLQEKMQAGDLAEWEQVFAEMREKAEVAKKKRAEEVSQAYTKKRDRGLDGVDEIKVNFGKKRPEAEIEVEEETEPESTGRKVTVEDTATQEDVTVKRIVPTKIIVEEPEIVLPEGQGVKKVRRIKKIIKKLVVE